MKKTNLFAVMLLVAAGAFAQTTYNWNLSSANAGGSWNTAGNWTPAGPAGGTDNTAFFNQPITTASTITLDGSPTIGNLFFGTVSPGTAAWTVSAGTPATSVLNLDVSSGTPTINVTNQSVTFNAPLISPALGITKTGAGTLNLAATNNFGTAVSSVNGGALQLGSLTALPASSQVSVSSGAALRADLPGTYNSIVSTITGAGISGQSGPGALWFRGGGNATVSWPGDIVLNGNASIGSYGVGYNVTLGGVISGTGNLTFNPQGGSPASHTAAFNLNNQSIYSGTTTFGNAGGLKTATWNWGTNNALPTATALTMNSSLSAGTEVVADFNGFSQTLSALKMNASVSTVTERLTSSSSTRPTVTINGASGTVFYVYQGTNNLDNINLQINTASGTDASYIGVNPTYTTLNVNNSTWNSSFYTVIARSGGATLNLNSNSILNNAGEVLIGYGNSNAKGTLNANAGSVINGYKIKVGQTAASILNLNAGATVHVDQIYNTANSNSVNLNGALVTPNAFLQSPWFASSLTNVQIQAGGAIFDTVGQDPLITANLLAGSPSGGLTKLGAGTLVISNANNTYTGDTIISNGTLAVDSTLTTSAVTNYASLAGFGTVGDVTMTAGSAIAPGRTNAAGTLTANNLTTTGSSEMLFDLSTDGSTIGGGVNDLLALNNASFGSQTVIGLNFPGGYPYASNRYVVATYSSSALGLANLALDPQLIGTRAQIGLDTGTPGQVAVVLTNGAPPNSYLTWYGNNPNNTWDLNTTPNWSSGSDYYFNADAVVFNDSAQTGTVSLSGTVYPGGVTFNNNSQPYLLTGSGKISGATSLTLNNYANVVLDANNDFTGGITLNGAGTLQIGNGDTQGAIGSGDVQFVNAGNTLAYNRTDALTLNNRIYGSSSAPANLQVNSGTLTLAGTADNSYAAATVASGATLVLAKSSTASVHALGSGLTVNSGGTVQFAGSGSSQLFGNANCPVLNNGTLDLAGQTENIAAFDGNGIVTSSTAGNAVLGVGAGNTDTTFTGVFQDGSGVVGLTSLGTGFTLTGTNTATGPLTIVGGGYVYLSNTTAQAWSGPVVFTNVGAAPRLIMAASQQLAGSASVISFGGTSERRVEMNGFDQTIGGLNDLPGVSGNRIVEAASDGVDNLPSTLTIDVLAGTTNSYGHYIRDAAATTNSRLSLIKSGGGTQVFSGSAGLVNISGTTTVSGGVLQLSGGSVLGNSAVTLAGGTLNISGGGTRAAAIAGNGTLQVGGGLFVTTATNTYTGNTFISAGTLQIGNGTVNGSISTDVTNNGALNIQVATNTVETFDGLVSGSGSFTKDAFGTLYFNGVNTFSGNASVRGGALWINNSQGLGLGTKTVDLANGTAGHPELHLNGTNGNIVLPATMGFSTSWSGTPVIQNEAGDNVINGNINLTSGGGDTYIAANGGTLTLAGGISPSQSNRNLLLGGVASGTVSGVISNGTQVLASLRKVDGGTWTISGSSTHSGPTVVEAGTLLVNGSLGTNTVTVSNNATLGGNGLILGAVTLLDGAVLAPGAGSIGTLTVSNTLTLAANSTNVFRLDATAITNDAVFGITTVNYGGTLIVTNTTGTLTAGQSYKLFDAGSYGAGSFSSVQLPALAGELAWTNELALNGTIAIVSTSAVNTNSAPITFNYSGGSLNLSWPPDHLGWHLQSQTNTLSQGLGTNWVDVPGSDVVTNQSISVDQLKGSVFFRLKYP